VLLECLTGRRAFSGLATRGISSASGGSEDEADIVTGDIVTGGVVTGNVHILQPPFQAPSIS